MVDVNSTMIIKLDRCARDLPGSRVAITLEPISPKRDTPNSGSEIIA